MSQYEHQQFVLTDALAHGRNHSSNALRDGVEQIWDPVNARFGSRIHPYIAAIPLFVAAFISLCFVLRWLFPRPPMWMDKFVPEARDKAACGDVTQKRRPASWSITLFVVSTAGFAMQAVVLTRDDTYLPAVFSAISWAFSLVLIALIRPISTSWSLLALYISIFTSTVIVVSSDENFMWRVEAIPVAMVLLAAIVAISIVFSMPMRPPFLSAEGISPVGGMPTKELRTPEDDISLWQWTTVSWMRPLITVGKSRQLNDEDVWSLGYEFQHRRLHDAFRTLNGTVLRRVLAANGLDLIIASVLAIIQILSSCTLPLVLQQLLASLENPDSPLRAAVVFAMMQFVLQFIDTQSSCYALWIGRRGYERSRGEMITMMYEKTLKRKMAMMPPTKHETAAENDGADRDADQKKSQSTLFKLYRAAKLATLKPWKAVSGASSDHSGTSEAKHPASMGKILNLMKSDVYEVAQQFWDWDTYIKRPLNIIVTIIFIWKLLGVACLLGALTVILAQIVTAMVARVLLRWEKIRRVATDVKLQAVGQFVEAIRHLRWYGWENAWQEQIVEKRQKELNLRVITSVWNMLIILANGLASGMFPVVAFYAYTVILGKPLRVDIAFPALSLFRNLEYNLKNIPAIITKALNAFVALRRVEDFMTEPDKPEPERQASLSLQPELKGATFAWPGGNAIVLRNVSLSFQTGLNVIGGKVAAGKTALLLALLGELDQLDGEYNRSTDAVGYGAQTPWLQSMSIKENILFHTPYNESRYRQVLDACALTPDLANFKHGDLSMIGENGIGLSGGQRARVALARAVYGSAKVLMLDDPLSALDHQTAESIVQKCLTGPLVDGRTVILVTHRLDICRDVANQLIEVEQGTARVVSRADLKTDADIGDMEEDEEPGKHIDQESEDEEVVDKFMDDEHRKHGGVEYSVYWEYIKAGKVRWWATLVFFLAVYQVIAVGQSWFLKEWGEAYNRVEERSTPVASFFARLPDPETNVRPWLIGFFVIAVAQTMANLIAQGFMLVIVYTAGRTMFRDVMQRVAHATFRFYDVTPTGRLMNRMTSDMGTIDGGISAIFQSIAGLSVVWLTSIVVIASVTPIFFVYSLAMTGAFVYIFLQFLPTSHSLRRLEMVSLSPLMSDFGALVDGLTTVRAFCVQSRFQDRVIEVVDAFQKMDHFYWSLQAWLNYRFDVLADISIFLLIMIALYTKVSPGLVAFALVSAGQFVSTTHNLCKLYGQLQMEFVSVERIVELLRLEQELPGSIDPPASWPTFSGDLVFSNTTLRYAPHLEPALHDLSFTIQGGSTTAIVGRTGSGKSTIALSLLGTLLPSHGTISIDGVDVASVNKQALRSRITFLAQDPVLFPGPLRANLDPLTEHSDAACEHVLARIAPGYGWTLVTPVDAGGRNLSQGQRQLIGLARAILRQSSVVILDEATASVDLDTSYMVQRVLREELKGATVVTIAHRVEAVRGAERYVVLGKGRLVESGKVVDGALVAESKG